MFRDRDLGILAVGAVMAVGSLLVPLSLAGRLVVGLLVLLAFMLLALLRVGPDRIPLEEWLRRRMRFHSQARLYSYHHRPERPERHPSPDRQPVWSRLTSGLGQLVTRLLGILGRLAGLARRSRRIPPPLAGMAGRPQEGIWPEGKLQELDESLVRPVSLAVDEVGVYPLASALLAVVGVYFLAWLAQGGGAEIGLLIELIIGEIP